MEVVDLFNLHLISGQLLFGFLQLILQFVDLFLLSLNFPFGLMTRFDAVEQSTRYNSKLLLISLAHPA